MASHLTSSRGCNGEDTSLSDTLLLELAERLHPNDYRSLGLRLGFTETRLSHLESSRRGNITECLYMMLTEWKRREGQGATSQVLTQSIKDCRNSEAVDWLHTEMGICQPASRTISMEEKLNEGNVPALPDCLTERPTVLDELRDKLRFAASANKPSRWVVVYGMGGMGKTVLANQAVRDEKLVEEFFRDGVFWMSMGNVKDVSSIPDRLETLCRIFDSNLSSSPSPPRTLEQWKHLLTKLISQRYSQSLVVLDDVWMPEVVGAFDVRCTVLITTRDSGVMSRVSGHKEELCLSEGLTEAQSIETLAEWTSTPITDLPQEAGLIHGLSHGSPLVIAIIGALLRDFPDRWQFYVSQMEAKKLQELSSDSSYNYRSAYDAIEMSMEQLSTDQMELYSWFAAFDQGTTLSSKVLAMLAECSKEEVEDRMRGILQRSLVSSDWSNGENCRVYWLHDLLYDHLVARDAAKNKPQSVCHEFKCLLVFRNYKMNRADLVQTALQFPTTTSVFRRAHRVASCTRGGFFLKETTDVRPLVHTIRHESSGKSMRCAKLLHDGKEVASTAYDGRIQVADVLTGEVRFKFNAHADTVNDLSLSPDGRILATCSADQSLCVWNLKSNDEHSKDPEHRLVKRLSHDKARITRCALFINQKELLLVSGDSSGLMKIWDSNFVLKHSIKAYDTAIVALSACDEGANILVCAKDSSTPKVFSATHGKLRFEIDQTDDVQDAAYLSNGLIVTLTWCELQVFNSHGRRICKWCDSCENSSLDSLACCSNSDGQFVAVLNHDGIITILRVGMTFAVTRKLSTYCQLKVGGVFRRVTSVSLASVKRGKSASESLYLTTTQDIGLIMVWKLEKQSTSLRVNSSLYDVSFKTNGEVECIVGSEIDDSNNIVMLTPVESGMIFRTSTDLYKPVESETLNAVDVHQSPGYVHMRTDSGKIKVLRLPKPGINWNSSKNKWQCFDPSENNVLLCQLIGDRRDLLTISSGSEIIIEIWTTNKPSTVICNHRVTSHQGLSADLSHDQTHLVVGCTDGTALLFTISNGMLTGDEPVSLQGPASRVSHAEFSADDKLLVLAGWRQIKVFDVETRKELANAMDEMSVSILKLSPDSSTVLSASGSVTTLREARTLKITSENKSKVYVQVQDAKFSPDGSMAMTAGHVKTHGHSYIEWWSIQRGCMSPLQTFRLNSRVNRVVCNPQFTTFVAVDEVGQIHILERIQPMR